MSHRRFVVFVINLGICFFGTRGASTSTSSPLVKTTGNHYKLETSSQVYDVKTQEKVEVTDGSTPIQFHCTTGSCTQVFKTGRSGEDGIKADVVVRIETKAKLDKENRFIPHVVPEIPTISYANNYWDTLHNYPRTLPDIPESFHIPNVVGPTNSQSEDDSKSGITVHTAIKINKGDESGGNRGVAQDPRIDPPYFPENRNLVPYNPTYPDPSYAGVLRPPVIHTLPPTNYRPSIPFDPHHPSLYRHNYPVGIPNLHDLDSRNSHYDPYPNEEPVPGTPYLPRYGPYDHPILSDYPSTPMSTPPNPGLPHNRYYPNSNYDLSSRHRPGTSSSDSFYNNYDTRQDYDIYHRQTYSNGIYSHGANPEVPPQPSSRYPQPTYPRPNYAQGNYPKTNHPQVDYPQPRLPLPRYIPTVDPQYEPQPHADSRAIGSDPYQARAQFPRNRLYGSRGIYRPQYPYQPRNLEPKPRPSISTTEEDDVKTYDYNTNGNDLRSISYFEPRNNPNNRGENSPVQPVALPRDYTYNPVEFTDIPKISNIDLKALLPKNNNNYNRSSYGSRYSAVRDDGRRQRNEKCDCDNQQSIGPLRRDRIQ